MSANSAMWEVANPQTWPQPPTSMSFSTLLEIEACPRRWALNAATYTEIWTNKGYPRAFQVAAVEGSIVHLALERITAALLENNCDSLKDQAAVNTIRGLGGFTAVLLDCAKVVLQTYSQNPRTEAIFSDVQRDVLSKVPFLRSRVQQLLARISLYPGQSRTRSSSRDTPATRLPLENGSHAEVRLSVRSLAWHGFADLLLLSPDSCEIRDFKTGEQKEIHSLQLKIYALLWSRDTELNPLKRLPTRLVISYGDKDQEIPAPTSEELDALEVELHQRTVEALAAISRDPPAARPSQDTCAFCSVRQLCVEYWQWLSTNPSSDRPEVSKFVDIEIEVVRRHGPNSWDSVVRTSNIASTGTAVLLHIANPRFDILPGHILRLVNVHVKATTENAVEGERSQVVATSSRSSEAFLVGT